MEIEMNLYRLSQKINKGYGTYDSCIVCAENEVEARNIHPCGDDTHFFVDPEYDLNYKGEWVWEKDKDKIKVELIGTAIDGLPKGVVLASFNAG